MRSAGTRVGVWPAMAKPHCADDGEEFGEWEVRAEAGDGFELVERSAGVAEASGRRSWGRRGQFAAAATMGAMSREVLSPTPPVECLSTVKALREVVSSVSPEKRIALVRAASSAGLRPRRKMAMRRAAVWASVGVGNSGVRWTSASMKDLISASERVRPSRLCWMTSMGWMVIEAVIGG